MAIVGWKDMATFLASKFAEYEAEMKDATSLQDNQKQFNENYISKEKQLALALEKMLPEEVRDQLKGKVTKTTTTGTTTAGGSYSGTVQEQFWQFFIADGYSKQAVAGMMGNIERETGGAWKGTVVEGGFTEYSGGIGLVQWTGGRNTNLRNFATEQGKEWSDFSVQLAFLKHELDTETWFGFTGGIAGFKKMTDIRAATAEFCWKFERPRADAAAMDVRNAAAEKYYNQFKDATFATGATGASGEWQLPVTGIVTSPFGMRADPFSGAQSMHKGVDIAGGGTDILATNSGTVEVAANGYNWGYGNYVMINHGSINGAAMKSLYAHLSSISISAGQKVTKGQKIGVMGSTGNSTGNHLHFEIRKNDVHENPENYITVSR